MEYEVHGILENGDGNTITMVPFITKSTKSSILLKGISVKLTGEYVSCVLDIYEKDNLGLKYICSKQFRISDNRIVEE